MSGAHERRARVVDDAGPEELSRIDLNLLVAFDALVREQSVTRAARRVGVTQSAMSHTLRRLRDLLGDPLLVRGQGGMMLTPRAESLVVPLRSGLVTLARALAQPQEFEPGSARRSFRLATPDLFDVVAMPLLLERIRLEAPGVDISLMPPGRSRLSDQLETGEVDVAVVALIEGDETGSGATAATASGLVRRTISRDDFTCLIRADHPALAGVRGSDDGVDAPQLSLAVYAQLSHALVSPTGAGPGVVDEMLARRGLSRRIALRLPYFYAAPAIIARSDLILTAPSTLARLVADGVNLVALSPPLELPSHSLTMIWHERFSQDPGHRWLREVMAEIGTRLP